MDDHWEYIAVYVDDLAIVSADAAKVVETLKTKYGYKIKGDGPMDYHLGATVSRDPDGTLSYSASRYIDKILQSYERQYGELPKYQQAPLPHGDHPELDMMEICTDEERSQFQSHIGAFQWLVSLGRFDILQAVQSLGRFCAEPCKGHLQCTKDLYGYLRKYKQAAIWFQTGMPDLSELPEQKYSWMHSIYGDVREELPDDMPTPLGKEVCLITYVDANLLHDYITGHSCTGVLHLLNQTPIEWFSKQQKLVQTATFGSEFVAAKQATEQIIDLCNTL